jgi:hypothetical protein
VKDVRVSFDVDKSRTWALANMPRSCWRWLRNAGGSFAPGESPGTLTVGSLALLPLSVVEIDRRRERRLRPSVLIRLLSAAQQRPPRFRAEQFLETLASGYESVVARLGKKSDAVVRLTDIWSVRPCCRDRERSTRDLSSRVTSFA